MLTGETRVGGDELLERDELLDGSRPRWPTPPPGTGAWCCSAARRAWARPPCCGFCAADRPARVLWGACERAVHPAAARAVPRHRRRGRRRARGALAATRGAPYEVLGALAARAAPRRRRPCSCSRTCTGPTRRRSTCSACSRAGVATAAGAGRWRPTATTSCAAAHRFASCSASSPARVASRLRARRRCRATRSPRWPARRGVDAEELYARRRATRSSSPRRWPPAAATSRHACATPCWRARPGSARGAAVLEAVGDRARARPSCGCSRRSPAAISAPSRSASRGHAARRRRRASRSATSWPAWRSRRRSPPTGGSRCTARRCRAARRAGGARPRAAGPPRRGGRRRRGGAALRPGRRRARRRRSARTARRPRSTPARCASPTAPARPSAPTLLERRSYECYLTDQVAEAIDGAPGGARRAPRARRPRARGRRAPLALAPGSGSTADSAAAAARRGQAVELLEASPPGRELAHGLRNLAQLRMLARRRRTARSRWGERAIELAERLGETEILVHALNNLGAAPSSCAAGRDGVRRSSSAAWRWPSRPGSRSTSRAPTRIWRGARSAARDYARADRYLVGRASAYCERARPRRLAALHDAAGWRARTRPGRAGTRPPSARRRARRPTSPSAAPRITPLVVLGRLRARRGDPGAWDALDEALALARRTEELQRLAPVAAARAEARWLDGRCRGGGRGDRRRAGPGARAEDPWAAVSCACGGGARVWPTRSIQARWASRSRLELRGEWPAAARAWDELGCPYEAALARADSDGRRSWNGRWRISSGWVHFRPRA